MTTTVAGDIGNILRERIHSQTEILNEDLFARQKAADRPVKGYRQSSGFSAQGMLASGPC